MPAYHDLEPGDSLPAPEFLLRYARSMPDGDLRSLLLDWGVDEERLEDAVEHWREESYVEHEVRRAVAEQWPKVEATARRIVQSIQAMEVHRRALPHTIRGLKVLRAASKGGKYERSKGPTDDQLRREVLALHEGRRSWTEACRAVGRAHSLTGRTVRRRVPDTKW